MTRPEEDSVFSFAGSGESLVASFSRGEMQRHDQTDPPPDAVTRLPSDAEWLIEPSQSFLEFTANCDALRDFLAAAAPPNPEKEALFFSCVWALSPRDPLSVEAALPLSEWALSEPLETRLSQGAWDWIERNYVVRQPDEVRPFLDDHRFLANLLKDALWAARETFNKCVVALKVFRDPEFPESDDQLYVCIITSLTPDQAFERKQEFDARWWLDAMDETKGQLCVCVEFR